jgi:hypothetical protein
MKNLVFFLFVSLSGMLHAQWHDKHQVLFKRANDPGLGGPTATGGHGPMMTIEIDSHGYSALLLHPGFPSSKTSGMFTHSSSQGTPLFISDAHRVTDWSGTTIQNGDFMNNAGNCPLPVTNDYLADGFVFLPSSMTDSVVKTVFHNHRDLCTHGALPGNSSQGFYVSQIHINNDLPAASFFEPWSSLGIIDSFIYKPPRFIRHGNGRDWWMVLSRRHDLAFKLISTEGDQPLVHNYILPIGSNFLGYAVSSKGNYVAIIYTKVPNDLSTLTLEILTLDRCTGQVQHKKVLPQIPYSDTGDLNNAFGFSPNERFVYYGRDTLWQADMWSELDTIPRVPVYIYDSLNFMEIAHPVSRRWTGIFNYFHYTRAGKIIGNFGSGYYQHTIHYPNEPGLACLVEPKTSFLLDSVASIVPIGDLVGQIETNFWSSFRYSWLNFSVYDLADSPCDTLGIDDPNREITNTHSISGGGTLSVTPNPASVFIEAFWQAPDAVATWSLYDLTGRLVWRRSANGFNNNLVLDVREFPPGTYLLSVQDAAGRVSTERVVVQY